MATLIPVTQPTNVEAAYEDMFKEITRKLYGEETGNGLHTLGTPVAHVATSGPTAPEGERSFTTLMSDRSLAPTIEYEPNSGAPEVSQPNFKSEDHLTTAFGLAALMQNGFPPTSAILNPQVIPKASTIVTPATSSNGSGGGANNTNTGGNNGTVNTNNSTAASNDQRWVNPPQEIMSWTGGKLASFNGAQKSNKSSKNRDQSNDIYHNTSGTSNTNTHANSNSNRKNKNSNNAAANNNNNTIQVQKRYSCTHCPYSTDRRDLYTRHENIHKDEKPFQCYACLKQFNRADHVKKHFLRMHRELTYDINKTRRQVSTEQKPGTFLHNVAANNPQQQMPDGFMNNQRSGGGGSGGGQQETASSLSIAQTIESVATAQISSHSSTTQMKQEKSSGDDKSGVKVKREKRFSCCYCPWTGADKWGLKRHLNTHTKPFVCMLCDYKAARSERLATHVLKVHNKKACNKCSFLADNQEEYQAHVNEMHPHDQRPARNNNSGNSNNVLRTIGNSLITNNQLNNFQNPSTSFGTVQTSNSGVAIYTSNDLTGTTNTNNTNGGLQEIVVNPTTASMVSWRLSATGSLIPPHIEAPTTTTGGNSTNSNQKRGAERLFQYLEADGSDPEDYARLLKMDAISRNTASVAQDFHNAGGVNINNNIKKTTSSTAKYLPQRTTLTTTTAASTHLQYQEINNSREQHQSNDCNDEIAFLKAVGLQRKAMSTMVKNTENIYQQQQQQQQLVKSPPAYSSSNLQNSTNKMMNSLLPSKGHRLGHHRDSEQEDKENSNSIFTHMEYENLSMIGIQFQNYVKEIINKYYAETPLLYSSPPPNIGVTMNPNAAAAAVATVATAAVPSSSISKPNKQKSETEEAMDYIEYLKNKGDITLTIAPKIQENDISSSSSSSSLSSSPISLEQQYHKQQQYPSIIISPQQQQKRKNNNTITTGENKRARKQAQPRKIDRSDVIMAMLRDKYLKKLVDPKKSCIACMNNSINSSKHKQHTAILSFPYHSPGSLALHLLWKHTLKKPLRCHLCRKKFIKNYSLKIHLRIKHKKQR